MDQNYAALVKGSPITISLRKFSDEDGYRGMPLAIVGPGPSFDTVPKDCYFHLPIFALNAAITETWQAKDVIWVSNDYDRTFENKNIREPILKGIEGWDPWRIVVNRKFVPGEFGNIRWLDHFGRWQDPMKWRLSVKAMAQCWWYGQNPGEEGYIDNGESVVELALEIARAWQMNPIVLIGVDFALVAPGRRKAILNPVRSSNYDYYAKPWQWKEMPARMYRGKLNRMRGQVRRRRAEWSPDIYTISRYWPTSPFTYIDPDQIKRCVNQKSREGSPIG